MTDYVIIGNSAGGVAAAEEIRKHDPAGAITIISAEKGTAYARALLSFYVEDKVTLDTMRYRDTAFYERNAITLIDGVAAQGVDVTAKTVALADGTTLPYDKLLIATGGEPFIPPMDGVDKEGVHTFTALQDAIDIKHRVDDGAIQHAVVIGGGFIGLQAAEALIVRGVSVTVVELADRVLPAILDPVGSTIVEKLFTDRGATVLTGHSVKAINGDAAVSGVTLDDGTALAADTVIVAIGVKPNIAPFKDAGITINRGITVNQRMETSAADVYACGDCAEVYDFITESARLTPLWPTAFIGGRVAGINMAGGDRIYNWGTGMNSSHLFEFPVMSAGIVNPPDGENYELLEKRDEASNTYKKIVLKDDRIMGMLLVNNVDRGGMYFGLMRNKVGVADFKDALLADDFGLVHFPKEMRTVVLQGGH